MFGKHTQFLVTKAEHYAIPIDSYNAILNNVTAGINTNLI